MNIKNIHIVSILLTAVLFGISFHADAQDMADYTAYPPFVTNAVEPNILLVLDHSGSMQFPAYTGCTFAGYSTGRAVCGSSDSIQSPDNMYKIYDNFGNENLYYGYFRTDKYYKHTGVKFEEDSSCTNYASGHSNYLIGDTTGCISGNLLNWAAMSRIDLMRKVLIGGKSVETQTNVHTLRPEGGWRTFSDHNLSCTFTIDGGAYPDLDHVLSISNYGLTGTCGYLTVWASGSSIWSTSDNFRYVYQPISGDFDVKLLIASAPSETGQTYAKAGLMVRASTAADSQHVMVNATYGAGLQFAYRPTNGGSTYTFANYQSANYPEWVRLVRSGDTFTAYYSNDGASWTQQGSITVAMPSSALIGMDVSSYSTDSLGSGEFDEFICDVCSDDDFNDYVFDTGIWTGEDIGTVGVAGSQIESCGGSCMLETLSSVSLQVDVPEGERKGIIQRLSDKDNDTQWDDNSPRFGLMVYASDSRYGEMRVGIEGSDLSSFLTALQNETPYYGTPTGEAMWEAYDYFRQIDNYSYEANTAYITGQGSLTDPMYDSGTGVACRKCFVLLISDGEWNGSVDPVLPARANHVYDIRGDLEGTQTISTYTVFTFSDADYGRNSLEQTAMFGDFDDYDSNTWPYNRTAYPADSRLVDLPAVPCDPNSTMDSECWEWDKLGTGITPDGIPDNYYEATDGRELESQLIEAISDMLKRASSGTAVSVLSTSGEGDGAIYQAYFYPQKQEDIETRKWLGYVQSLFVDEYGNMREDTDGDDALNLSSDLILEMSYSEEFGTQIKKYNDIGGDGDKDGAAVAIVEMSDVNAIWKGGDILWQTDPANRTIYTSVDGYNFLDFSTANTATLEPYLRAADSTEAANMINWVRGADLGSTTDTGHATGYRNRNVTINNVTNVWKLGDIVYSTPTVAGKPMENYDFIYGDSSYKEFESQYLNRRHVVYAGANDGMLHAFNAGCFDESNHKFYPDTNGSVCTDAATIPHTLGEELWAFIPRGLLPHLQWLSRVDYTHVYYVDQKPKLTDVKVFSSDTTHTEGWGTILIGGFRYGGKSISWTSGATSYTASPEYFALDVTDPLNPILLWTFAHPDFGLSMSYPSVAKIGDSWYVVFGSGATNFDSASNLTAFQDGYIFVLKISGGSNGVISTWTENLNFWKIPTGNTSSFLADSITVDRDIIDYAVDVIYIGENYEQAGIWNSLMRRLTTAHGTETVPSAWQLSTLMDVNTVAGIKDVSKRITSAPSAASDDRGNLWTFFGTGKFYGLDDKNTADSGAFYAVKDHCWDGSCTDSYTGLLDVSGASVDIDGSVTGISATCGSGTTTEWYNLISTIDTCDGWSIYFGSVGESTDFAGDSLNHAGERSLSKPVVVGGVVALASYIPGTDECSALGESNAYAVYYKTGTAYRKYIFEEQKKQTAPSSTIARVKNLGVGMPSSPSTQVTKEGKAKLYFQQSTGAILTIENDTPFPLKSGIQGWKSEHIP